MRYLLPALFLALLQPATHSSAHSQPGSSATAAVTLERIMAHPDWIGRAPEAPYWADDSDAIYYMRSRPRGDDFDSRERDLYTADLAGIAHRLVPVAERALVDSRDGSFDLERRFKAYAHEGDIFVKDLSSGSIRQLTRTAARERSPQMLIDGRVAFRRDDQILARDLDLGLEEEVFDLRAAEDPVDKRRRDLEKPDYLRDQQSRLFRWLREERAREDHRLENGRDKQRQDPTRADLTWYLGSDVEIGRTSLSPTGGRALVVLLPEKVDEGRRDEMPQYVTASGYVETRDVRPKVGTRAAVGERLLLLTRDGRKKAELDLSALPGISEDPLAELRAAAERRRENEKARNETPSGNASSEPSEEAPAAEPARAAAEASDEQKATGKGRDQDEPKPRALRFTDLLWSGDGLRAVIQAVSLDNKDRWIAAVDLEKGTLRPLHRITDPAWTNWRFRDLGWLPDHRTLYFLSEESGYSQLYLLETDSGSVRRLTEGEAVVDSVTVARKARWLYYTANPEHPGVYEIFRVETKGGPSQQLTTLGGRNSYVLSPDEEELLITHSTTTRPPELYVQDARPGAKPRRLTETASDEFLAISWVEPAVVEVPSSHQQRPIYSRLYLPPGEAPSEGRPAVVFVHGAGYLQNSHRGWSSYFREFMFHTLLVERGYVVLDMDYRASAGYGRDWRTAIYRQMGQPEVEDLADGVAYLAREHGVDPGRVGVYGGSYGGFLTLMALFTRPDLFAAGAALRPVTDWAHYNHPYTSNILNTPEVDPEAYARSSPIEHAEGLARPLLICTGMLDNNVLFQDSVRLVQRLIELEKQDWEIAIYPVEPHGFREPSSWLDEYRRILRLFDTHLK